MTSELLTQHICGRQPRCVRFTQELCNPALHNHVVRVKGTILHMSFVLSLTPIYSGVSYELFPSSHSPLPAFQRLRGAAAPLFASDVRSPEAQLASRGAWGIHHSKSTWALRFLRACYL
ncbi:hypothetical protein MTO96_021764 [Rhipicephalus appendiculatus]